MSTPDNASTHDDSNSRRGSSSFNRMEEYKAVMQNYAHVGSRRQFATSVFISLNVVFLTAIGILLRSSHLTSWWDVAALGGVTLAILPINWAWFRTVQRHQYVTQIYYRYLQDIEKEFTSDAERNPDSSRQPGNAPPSIGLYLRQGDVAYTMRHGAPQIEKRLALYFVLLYPLITLLAALLTYLAAIQTIPAWG